MNREIAKTAPPNGTIMKRRAFLKSASCVVGSAAVQGLVPRRAKAAAGDASKLYRKLPRWRGFNLVEKMKATAPYTPYRESDFEWMADWGFDFVRLPTDYQCWTDSEDPYKLDEKSLKQIDQAIDWGRQYGMHVSLCMHHAPGYRVAKKDLKMNLWEDEEAQKQFDFQWSHFASRYQGISSKQLSFDLVNEPGKITPKFDATIYSKVVRRVIAAIRRKDPTRLIISDGLKWGRIPVFELVDQKIAQSTRGYRPGELTHYKAPWRPPKDYPEPSWPMTRHGEVRDRDWIDQKYVQPWKDLESQGVGVHVGEWGILNTVPHEIALAWSRDVLSLWKEADWGWALWNFRGEHGFGFLNTNRADVVYENFHGHRLDRKMLELLLEF